MRTDLLNEELLKILDKLGKRCSCCGQVVYTQLELSLKSEGVLHVSCESVAGYVGIDNKKCDVR